MEAIALKDYVHFTDTKQLTRNTFSVSVAKIFSSKSLDFKRLYLTLDLMNFMPTSSRVYDVVRVLWNSLFHYPLR